MEREFLNYSIITLLTALIFIIFRSRTIKPNRLPPGPTGWPIFGNMFSLGPAPHRTIAALQPKYGGVVWLKLGSVNTMAVLTAEAAADLFKNHDLSFADRSIVDTMTASGYHNSSLALAPYGPRWRVLRRLCTVEMFAGKRINETASIRRKCVDDMVTWIEKDGRGNNTPSVHQRYAHFPFSSVHQIYAHSIFGKESFNLHHTISTLTIPTTQKVNKAHFLKTCADQSEYNYGGRREYVFLATFNMLGNLMMSRDLVDLESKKGTEFYGAMKRVMEWSGRPNVSDQFPWTRWIDLQGLKRRASRDMGIAFGIVSGFVKERIRDREQDSNGEKDKDFLDVLLEFDEVKGRSGKLSETDIIIFILEMFLAGTETTSSSIEWAMTELLRNPTKMSKAKAEISGLIGPTEKFQESHIDDLPYLQALIKETLRLHPPIPFLIPRRAVRDTEFMGYLVPKNTQVFINVWGIGRDQERWQDADSFKPERFLGTSDVDYRGQHFEMIPFGAGRRMCVGLALGHRMLHFVLGSLLHEFEWEPVGSDAMDMNERMGITVGKLRPLVVVPRKCVA